ncbi:uncharacterized protein LOC129217408 [Uloborus diversus]|uniref:uncharacterized protein LOC129217408 n=1 Tax=Uloborus diversus TaxID=327109 RepID=UPI00240A968F|nr:uncharacterized protein LOC129217408 [Uloborus diversus]
MEKRLISKVCERDLLYAIDSVNYRDRHMRALAWAEIGKELGIPAAQCKDMWRKLRNCYLNAINRRQGKKTAIPKWKYEDEMSFLLPFVEIRSSEHDLENHSSSSNISNSYNEINMDSIEISEREDSPEIIIPETSSMVSGSKKDQDIEPSDFMQQMMGRRKPNYRKDYRAFDRQPSSLDETEMFFLSMSETVKRLSPVDQAKIKMELCKMVYEAEIRHLEGSEYEEHM